MKKLVLTSLCLSLTALTGCAGLRSNIRRHPLVYGGVTGAVAGVTIGILTRPAHCPSIINGYPYNGTPGVNGCPNPATYDPGRRK